VAATIFDHRLCVSNWTTTHAMHIAVKGLCSSAYI